MIENKISCLLVEDDPIDQELFLDTLADIAKNCKCYVVPDGEQALLTLLDDDLQPDYIFTDIHMPIIDGFELLTILKGIESLKHIPVIILSSDFSDAQMRKASSLGAAAFYSKTRFDMLSESLKKYFRDSKNQFTIL